MIKVTDRLWNRLRLAYNELTYWLIGLPPESYHSSAATIWSELANHRKAIEHCKKYLQHAQSDHIKALLGFSYNQLGDSDASLNAYRSLDRPISDPMFALGLAEAELDAGDVDRTREIIQEVLNDFNRTKPEISDALIYLESRISTLEELKSLE